MVQTSDKIYTVEEYLELEKSSEIRHEYVYGKLIPMSGESKIANWIAGNCYNFLRNTLNEDLFETYNHEVRLMVDGRLYRYPDVVVIPVTDDGDLYAMTQPILIIEVLSDSTENVDRGEKLHQYSQLPSLQHYLLVSQDKPLVQRYSRQDGSWALDFYDTLDETITISALNVELSLKTIYKKVKFSK